MSVLEIPFEEMKTSMIQEIRKHEWGYLATSDGDKIRVGKMRLVSDGLRLWCFTLDKTRKFKQMLVKPNVAIADGNLQVEGIATLKGHPYDEENADFLRVYKETQPVNFERTSRGGFKRPNSRIIEIKPERIAVYGASNKMLAQMAEAHPESNSEELLVEATENYYDILNLKTKKAYRANTSPEKQEEIWDSQAYNE